MEFPIKFDTVKSGWFIVYIEGSQITLLSLKINFVLANGADPDEMPHYAAFHQGLHLLGFLVFKGLINSQPNSRTGSPILKSSAYSGN